MTTFREICEDLRACVDNGFVGDIADWDSINIVCIVVVCYEVVLISVDGYGWKCSGGIGV